MNKDIEAKLEPEDGLSQIAAQRREQARKDIQKEGLSEFVISIHQSEVLYTLEPSSLPFKYADLDSFANKLRELYSLTIQKQKKEENQNPLAALIGDQQQTNVLVFESGRFKTQESGDFIPIPKLTLTSEKVHIVLQGPSNAAKAILADVLEALWQSTGMPKPWSSLEKSIQLVSYGTGTKVNLGIPLEKLIHPKFAKYLEDHWTQAGGFAEKMAHQSTLNNFQSPKGVSVGYAVDDLNFKFNIFDPVTGDSTRASLKFIVTAKHEYGKGIFLVVSELPFELHVKALAELRDFMKTEG